MARGQPARRLGDARFRVDARRTHTVREGVDAEACRRWLDLRFVAEGVRRPWALDHGERRLERGIRQAGRTDAGRLLRRHPCRPDDPTVGLRGTEAVFPAEDPEGRDRLVPGILGARRRFGSRLAQDPSRARRRRVGDQRPESLDDPGAVCRLHLPPLPDRPRRATAQGHLVPAGADAPARDRGTADRTDGRVRGVQRGVLHQRPVPSRRGCRRGRQRLVGRDDDARLRARYLGHDRLPALPEGARPHHPTRPKQRETERCSDPAASRTRLVQGEDHADQRTSDTDGSPQRRQLGSRPGCDQQDVLVRVPPGRDGAGHRHLGHGGPDPHRPGGRRRCRRRRIRPAVGGPRPRPGYPVSALQTSFFFSRSETIWGGTAQIQRNIVAERVLGLPKEPKLEHRPKAPG